MDASNISEFTKELFGATQALREFNKNFGSRNLREEFVYGGAAVSHLDNRVTTSFPRLQTFVSLFGAENNDYALTAVSSINVKTILVSIAKRSDVTDGRNLFMIEFADSANELTHIRANDAFKIESVKNALIVRQDNANFMSPTTSEDSQPFFMRRFPYNSKVVRISCVVASSAADGKLVFRRTLTENVLGQIQFAGF